jgi:hypothetical protein
LDSKEIKEFLINLDYNKVYVVTFDLVFSCIAYDSGSPFLILSKPILVTNQSNPELISNFIKKRIDYACDIYMLDR